MKHGAPSYINLDPFVDISALESLHDEICYGLAKSEFSLAARPIPHLEMSDSPVEKLIEFKHNEGLRVEEIIKEAPELLSRHELKYYRALNHEQKKRFLIFYKNAYCDGEYVRLRYPRKEFRKNQEAIFYSKNCDWHPNSQHFEKTLSFIKDLPFMDLGRVVFFITYQYMKSDIHHDRSNECYDGRHHYLWINPFRQKKFFLLHEDGSKEYIDSKVCIFDGTILHGCDAPNKHVYSLRIDGQLNPEFCQIAGIPWKARP